MYGYINGLVTEIECNYIILENSGIGYLVYVANPYSYILNNSYKIYIYSYIREDEHTLYGFKEKEELNMFLKLISVKGLGPKMTLPILATGSTEEIINAIERENILYLKKFPKIGDKVAKQIILDLKGKFKDITPNTIINTNEDLYATLIALGYKTGDIKKVIAKVDTTNSLEGQIKEALKFMLKG